MYAIPLLASLFHPFNLNNRTFSTSSALRRASFSTTFTLFLKEYRISYTHFAPCNVVIVTSDSGDNLPLPFDKMDSTTSIACFSCSRQSCESKKWPS